MPNGVQTPLANLVCSSLGGKNLIGWNLNGSSKYFFLLAATAGILEIPHPWILHKQSNMNKSKIKFHKVEILCAYLWEWYIHASQYLLWRRE
mmetsp:Transcript_11793/g.14680  ORF Transcript_11793/g.14680 Transcript_11793/m.14680 type:complete len:92 (-) Transcript_11793:319-594(-)